MELLTSNWWLFDEIGKYFLPEGSTRRWVMFGAILLGISSGVIGSFALLRKQSLLSDAMAHAALPGICLIYMLTGVKDPLLFLVGASITGLLGAIIVSEIPRHTRIKSDTAIGLVLSVFFAFGIVLLTVIQKNFGGNQAGLDAFLFGKAALLVRYDLYVIGTMCLLLIGITLLFYKEFKLLTFDRGFAITLGLPAKKLELCMTLLIVLAVMVGLQAVGVVLMVAMLIFPAAAARQWTDQLGRMIIIAAFVGGFAGVVGSFCSAIMSKVPTGPVMVVVCSTMLIFSMFFAPNRGLIPKWLRLRNNRQRIRRENILKSCYKTCEERENWKVIFTLKDFTTYFRFSNYATRQLLHYLVKKQRLVSFNGGWQLTPQGLDKAEQIIRKHRLWEVYLTEKMDIASDHVHRDAEDIEHALDDKTVQQLEEELQSPTQDPHGKSIPNVDFSRERKTT
ncbi:metal ABC transporter permease [Candidatus Uabimicrobium amorphum]|uniref:Manganese transport system membrane protein MntC n=1 Tax=Uabimicrobium amorphum TaxID=2596890 RepID=A0A5S9ITT0_UABAM|nr:iron chelate uptake ABC transporter family permease subunit [Candidatus Uabimicrobium amorphum]BBM87617.1 manganese transport system membrane protein MntC [Candidatus Uabimicrobium amorphum]